MEEIQRWELDDFYEIMAKSADGEFVLYTDHLTTLAEHAKYKAFWDWSRLADKQSFELYDWPKNRKEAEDE